MATIIAGLFDTSERAERAAQALLGLGVPRDRIDADGRTSIRSPRRASRTHHASPPINHFPNRAPL